uniref:Diphthamide biosynthesis protein 3 n=1 Tax=Mastacembelus armatus TaxID=205130 RepID=A0A7N8Y9E9_9TELE
MSVFHDEIEIEDFEYDEDTETYYFPCPCGDRFAITKEDLENGEEVATCPSCSLIVKVIYDKVRERLIDRSLILFCIFIADFLFGNKDTCGVRHMLLL